MCVCVCVFVFVFVFRFRFRFFQNAIEEHTNVIDCPFVLRGSTLGFS